MNDTDNMYIELLKQVLTDSHRMEFPEYRALDKGPKAVGNPILILLDKILRAGNYLICKKVEIDPQKRLNGLDWPANAETMTGIKRLDNLQYCVAEVIKNKVEGDLIETGVWRGGSTIFMKALLKAAHDQKRVVWVADSFEGLPKPDAKYAADKNDRLYTYKELAIPLAEVRRNFEKYGLLDEKVKFLKGWFKDTLPTAPINKLAVLRLDGDMYESTMDALVNLYPKLSKGGFIIVDDYLHVEACKAAVQDYRRKNNISEEIKPIDPSAVFWKKEN
jgi:O-methyltransferase